MKKGIIVFLILFIILFFIPVEYEKAQIVRVIDGDTVIVKINSMYHKVRFLLINTPEMKDDGIYAKKYLEKILVKGTKVYLERDLKNKDKYGRLLRHLYLNKEDVGNIKKSINYMLVKEGYAEIVSYSPNYKHLLKLYYYTKFK